jgi:proline iminopeptidase
VSIELIKAWEAISSPSPDPAPFEKFQPDVYRYTNSTNPWKKRSKRDVSFQDGPTTICTTLRGETIGPRSGQATFLAMDRQGGPALPLTDEWRSNANCDQYRMIIMDPRGVGGSLPLGALNNNTAPKLVWDMEQGRKAAAKTPDEKMVLRGNCWGMTESVLYAATYPNKVAGLVLGLPFLAREKDINWMFAPDGGLSNKYPDAYAQFWDYTRLNTPAEMMDRFVDDLGSDNRRIQAEAFCAFMAWEYACYDGQYPCTPDMLDINRPSIQQELASRRIQARYTRDGFDLNDPEGIAPLLDRIPKTIPMIIVGNLFDPLNAPDTIDVLRQKCPQAEIIMQNADWHWIPSSPGQSADKSNEFIQQAYPYAMGRMGFVLADQIEQRGGFQMFQRMLSPC